MSSLFLFPPFLTWFSVSFILFHSFFSSVDFHLLYSVRQLKIKVISHARSCHYSGVAVEFIVTNHIFQQFGGRTKPVLVDKCIFRYR